MGLAARWAALDRYERAYWVIGLVGLVLFLLAGLMALPVVALALIAVAVVMALQNRRRPSRWRSVLLWTIGLLGVAILVGLILLGLALSGMGDVL